MQEDSLYSTPSPALVVCGFFGPWGEVISRSFDFLAIISERCLGRLLVLKYYVSKDHFLSRSYFLQHIEKPQDERVSG